MAAAPTAIAGLLLLVVPALALAQRGLMVLPLGDPAYEQLWALERSGCVSARVSAARPYDLRSIRAVLTQAANDARCQGILLTALQQRFAVRAADTVRALRVGGSVTAQATGQSRGAFLPLWNDVRSSGSGDPPLVGTARLRLSYGDGDRFAAVLDGYGESNIRNDPLARARNFRGRPAVVDASEAYVAARALGITFSLGREREAWLGDSTESMWLGANGPPLDRLAASFQTRRFEGHFLFGMLDDAVLTAAQDSIQSQFGPQRYYRYLAAHMITWRPSRVIEWSAGETALLARGSHVVDLYYVNPFVPYLAVKHDTGRTGNDALDNLTFFTGLRVHAGRATFVGEWLVDDIQIDAKDRRVTPDQLGWHLAATAPAPLPVPATLALSYERINSYTYMDGFYAAVWQYYNRPIGSALGPDADYLHADADLFPTPTVRLAGGLGLWRRGLRRIFERPGVSPVGQAHQPFPTSLPDQPAQRGVLANASAQLLSVVLPLTLRVDAAHVTNVDNVPIPAATYARVQLLATYAFRYP